MKRPLILATSLISLLPLTACLKFTKDDEKTIGQQTVTQAMPRKGEVVDARHGKELWFAIGAVSGTEGLPGNGVTSEHYFQDGTFLAVIQANLPLLDKGSFYHAYLVQTDGKQIDIGRLTNSFGDTRYALRTEIKNDLRNKALKLAIKEELKGQDPGTLETVAEGSVTPHER